jgi:hypothetical protein
MSSFSSSPLVAEVLDSPHEAGDRAMNATVLTENGFTASVLGIHEAEIHVMSDTRVKVSLRSIFDLCRFIIIFHHVTGLLSE